MFREATDTDFNIDRHLISLLETSPFFAEISRHIRKVITRDVPTAGVTYDMHHDDFVMGINPDFFATLTKAQINGVLRHEFYHIVFLHITTRHKKPAARWNIATDLAINSIIMDRGQTGFDASNPPLPDCALVPGKNPFPPHPDDDKPVNGRVAKINEALRKLIESLPCLESSEFYFEKLTELANELTRGCSVHGEGSNGNPGQGQNGKKNKGQKGGKKKSDKDQGGDQSDEQESGTEGNDEGHGAHDHDLDGDDQCTCGGLSSLDDHDGWEQIPDEMKEYVEGKARHLIEKAAKHADSQSNGWGNMPTSIRDEIRRMINRVIDWKKVLRQFVASIAKGGRSTTIRRINKKYPYIHPGVKRDYVAKLAIAVDQSGSVDNQMLSEFFAELDNLTRKVSITVIPFDYTVEKRDVFEWKKGQHPKLARVKGGGTSFDAPTAFVNLPENRGRWDGLLIMTDGECSPPAPSRIKRGWVLAGGRKLAFNSDEIQINIEPGTPTSGAWR